MTHPFGHVACWVDGTASGAAALAMAVDLWRDADGRLSLLHATPDGETRGPDRLRDDWLRLRGAGLPGAEPVFLTDDPGDAVCDWARSERPNVIVVGTGAGRPPGLTAGRLADQLLERAPCAVLLVEGARAP
ncbi:MAG TPA: universal stress protein [Miltoncostaeaceae bacterium]|nr:universal stress protein [Miltoncostaeaceae bacterium]